MAELTVTQAAEDRHSIRKYTDEQIPSETIDELLRVASLAPSPWNVQPWRVVVVTSQEDKDKLKAASYGQPQVGDAAAVFVIYTDMPNAIETIAETVHPGMPEDRKAQEIETITGHFAGYKESDLHWWGRAQGYSFMSFLLLAAQSHGYATSAMLGFEPDKVKALYNLPEHVEIPAIVAMGRPDQEGFPTHRHPLNRFVTKL